MYIWNKYLGGSLMRQEIEIDGKLYKQICEFCEFNKLNLQDYLIELINKGFSTDRFGDLNILTGNRSLQEIIDDAVALETDKYKIVEVKYVQPNLIIKYKGTNDVVIPIETLVKEFIAEKTEDKAIEKTVEEQPKTKRTARTQTVKEENTQKEEKPKTRVKRTLKSK